jgi:hypothetical protein
MLTVDDFFWPILLKTSAMDSSAEKYALEIEIFTFEQRIPRSDFA